MRTLSVLALLLVLLPSISHAQLGRGLRELTLSGSGSSSREFDAGNVSATGELGWYYSPKLELGLRQSLSWSKNQETTFWDGATRFYSDYHYGSGQWRPYFGASFGIAYGTTSASSKINTSFFAGPEAGLKFYVQPAAFLFFQMEYQFRFSESDELTSTDKGGVYTYSFGAGYNF